MKLSINYSIMLFALAITTSACNSGFKKIVDRAPASVAKEIRIEDGENVFAGHPIFTGPNAEARALQWGIDVLGAHSSIRPDPQHLVQFQDYLESLRASGVTSFRLDMEKSVILRESALAGLAENPRQLRSVLNTMAAGSHYYENHSASIVNVIIIADPGKATAVTTRTVNIANNVEFKLYNNTVNLALEETVHAIQALGEKLPGNLYSRYIAENPGIINLIDAQEVEAAAYIFETRGVEAAESLWHRYPERNAFIQWVADNIPRLVSQGLIPERFAADIAQLGSTARAQAVSVLLESALLSGVEEAAPATGTLFSKFTSVGAKVASAAGKVATVVSTVLDLSDLYKFSDTQWAKFYGQEAPDYSYYGTVPFLKTVATTYLDFATAGFYSNIPAEQAQQNKREFALACGQKVQCAAALFRQDTETIRNLSFNWGFTRIIPENPNVQKVTYTGIEGYNGPALADRLDLGNGEYAFLYSNGSLAIEDSNTGVTKGLLLSGQAYVAKPTGVDGLYSVEMENGASGFVSVTPGKGGDGTFDISSGFQTNYMATDDKGNPQLVGGIGLTAREAIEVRGAGKDVPLTQELIELTIREIESNPNLTSEEKSKLIATVRAIELPKPEESAEQVVAETPGSETTDEEREPAAEETAVEETTPEEQPKEETAAQEPMPEISVPGYTPPAHDYPIGNIPTVPIRRNFDAPAHAPQPGVATGTVINLDDQEIYNQTDVTFVGDPATPGGDSGQAPIEAQPIGGLPHTGVGFGTPIGPEPPFDPISYDLQINNDWGVGYSEQVDCWTSFQCDAHPFDNQTVNFGSEQDLSPSPQNGSMGQIYSTCSAYVDFQGCVDQIMALGYLSAEFVNTAALVDSGYSEAVPPSTSTAPAPAPAPAPASVTCRDGYLYDGTPVTGELAQVVCGGGGNTYECTEHGWKFIGGACGPRIPQTVAPVIAPTEGSLAVCIHGNGTPIGGVLISASGPVNASSTTDSNGCTQASLPFGHYLLTASKDGQTVSTYYEHSTSGRVLNYNAASLIPAARTPASEPAPAPAPPAPEPPPAPTPDPAPPQATTGRITVCVSIGGSPLPGVTISVDGPQSGSATTGENGCLSAEILLGTYPAVLSYPGYDSVSETFHHYSDGTEIRLNY